MRGKKGDIEDLIIILFVLMAIGGILVKSTADKQIVINIGGKQAIIFEAYAEAEKVREYFNGAARLAAINTAKELGAKGDNCFMVPGFNEKFNDKIESYSEYGSPTNPLLTVSLPYVAWSTTALPNKIAIVGATSDKIVIKGEGFEYKAGLHVSQIVSCEDLAVLTV